MRENLEIRISLVDDITAGLSKVRTGLGRLGSSIGGINVGGIFSSLTRGASVAFSVIGTAARAGAAVISAVFSTAISLLKGAFIGLGAAAGAAIAGIYAGIKLLRPAGFIEQQTISFLTLTKSVELTQQRMQFLKDFFVKSPFDLKPVLEGGKLMEAFGIFTKRGFTAAADTAAAFGASISEVVRSISYLSAGRAGEALESLSQFGITRGLLSAKGIVFDRGGSLVSSIGDTMEALLSVMEERFGGMSDKMSKTFEGVMSTIGGVWFNFWAEAGAPLLQYVTPAIQEVADLITRMTDRVKTVDFSALGVGILASVQSAVKLIDDLFDPTKRGQLFAGAFDLVKSIPSILLGAALDVAETISNLFSNTTLGANLSTLFSNAWTASWQVIDSLMMGSADRVTTQILLKIPFWRGEETKRLFKIAATKPEFAGNIEAIKSLPPGLGRNDAIFNFVRDRADEIQPLNFPTRQLTPLSLLDNVSTRHTKAALGELQDNPLFGYINAVRVELEANRQAQTESKAQQADLRQFGVDYVTFARTAEEIQKDAYAETRMMNDRLQMIEKQMIALNANVGSAATAGG